MQYVKRPCTQRLVCMWRRQCYSEKGEGGGGFQGKKHSEEVKNKIKNSLKQKYIDNPELKKMVDHINGNRIDDRIENLQWESQSNNLKKKKMGKGFFEQRVKY